MDVEQEHIWQCLSDDEQLKELSHNEIDQWIAQYPYVAAFHFIKARKYVIEGQQMPDPVLHRAATYSNDRRWLKQKLLSEANDHTTDEEEADEMPPQQEAALDEMKSPDQSQEKNRSQKKKKKRKQSDERSSKKKSSPSSTDKVKKGMEQFEDKITSFTQWLKSLDHPEESSEITQKKKKKKGKKKKKKKKLSRLDKLLLNSVQIKEDIISETYAELLYQQGHVKRAIEMYKALIIKYPEKSDTFASKLEKIEKEKL